MSYVLQKSTPARDPQWVARPGGLHSYTDRLDQARVFATREEAERDRCSNEVVVDLANIFRV